MWSRIAFFLLLVLVALTQGCGHRPLTPFEAERRALGKQRLWSAVRSAPCVVYPTSPPSVEREMRIRVLDGGGHIVCPSNLVSGTKLVISASYPIQSGRYVTGSSCYGAIIEVSWEGQDPFLYGETEVDQCSDSNLSPAASYEWATDTSFWTAYHALRPVGP